MDQLLAFLLGYALGSIPFGLILTRMAGLGDVRAQGSGSIGATNVLRTGNRGIAAATLALDLLKGLAAVLLAKAWFAQPAAVANVPWNSVAFAALGAVLGHCFPVWLGFRGGKGVATNAGVAFGLATVLGLTYAVIWLGILAITRISSVAGISAVVATAFVAAIVPLGDYFPVLAIIAVLVIWLHRGNIARLLRGEEPRVGKRR